MPSLGPRDPRFVWKRVRYSGLGSPLLWGTVFLAALGSSQLPPEKEREGAGGGVLGLVLPMIP